MTSCFNHHCSHNTETSPVTYTGINNNDNNMGNLFSRYPVTNGTRRYTMIYPDDNRGACGKTSQPFDKGKNSVVEHKP